MKTAAGSTFPDDDTNPCRGGVTVLPDEMEVGDADLPVEPPAGGDFHAAFSLPDGKVGVILGDVTGHGPEAVGDAARLCDALAGCMAEGLPPAEAVGFVNAAVEMDPDFTRFATVFAGTVEPDTGRVAYASAGQEPGLLAGPEDEGKPENIRKLANTGPPIGVAGADEVRYGELAAALPEGGTLLLYTDGVTEARRGNRFFGLARVRELFARFLALSPARLAGKLLGRARAFASGARLRDDAAVLVLRRRAVADRTETPTP